MTTAPPAPQTVLGPGIHDGVPAEVYHADPCPTPSLSASIAKILVKKSAVHARKAHPRVSLRYEPKTKTSFDIGTAAHAILLEGTESRLVPIDARDFKTNDAKAQRDAAYAAGKTPLLREHLESVREMAAAARAQLAAHEEGSAFFNPLLGRPEQTIVWREEKAGIWCRSRIDWLPYNGNLAPDYKSTESAHPDDFERRVDDVGHDIQVAFYRRGLRAVTGREWELRLVAQETSDPYALSVIGLLPSVLYHADEKVELAIDRWSWALKTGRWGGYANRTCWVETPGYSAKRWEEAKERRLLLSEANEDERAFALTWQAPLPAAKEAA